MEPKKQNKKDKEKEERANSTFQIPGKISASGSMKQELIDKREAYDLLDPTKREEVSEKRKGKDTGPVDIDEIERNMRVREYDEDTLRQESRKIEEKQAALTADTFGLPFINLYGFPINQEALEQLTEKEAREHELIPFYIDDTEIRLATPNPRNKKQKEILDRFTQEKIVPTLYYVSQSSFDGAVEAYKDIIVDKKKKEDLIEVTDELLGELSEHIDELKNVKDRLEKLSVTEIIDILLGAAVKIKASDIHFEPAENEVRMRYRVDGVLEDVMAVPKSIYAQVLSRVKLVSKMKVNITQIPQDGRFSVKLPDRKLDIRVSVLPSGYGESIVMRLLGIGTVALKIEQLGLKGYSKDVIMKQLEKPYGMILTTGPTGSGKTTTLYTFLTHLNRPGVKIITLEDPIEYRLEGIQQTQIDREAGLDFAAGLRSVLRHDPDVVLVGEIRDLETAEIAINAAQTGHVVFSTLHTNDAAGVLPRLINMGLRQFVIAPAINAVIAQRLVRVLCEKCKEAYDPSPEEMTFIEDIIGKENMDKYFPKKLKLYKANRCKECTTGYSGRLGIFEVFEVGDDMEKLIIRSATVAEIREKAVEAGMLLMVQDGIMKAAEGLTTLSEVKRVTAT